MASSCRLLAGGLLMLLAPCWAVPLSGASGGGSHGLTVIQGETAARGEFPWQAQLKRDGAHVCGAVLLSDEWLVTAAHCLTPNLDTSAYQVVLGEYDVRVEEGSEQRRAVAEMVFSSLSREGNSEPGSEQNDIALIRLGNPANFSTYVKAIELPEFEEDFTDLTAVASGWGVSGSTAVGPIFPDKLQKMTMTLLSDTDCLSELIFFDFAPGPMTCARPEAGSSLCWGDSGGALTFHRSSGEPVLAAVTSWGVDCDLNGRPTVFVDIGFFVNWIKDTVG